MVAEAMTFRELTGSRRQVELRDRALPFRPVAFPGTVKYVKTVYPGNPTATIQVLAPNEEDIMMNGVWHARYLGFAALLTGFDDLAGVLDEPTPEILDAVFTRLRRAGNEIELSWGPRVFRGIISKFEPNYRRTEDVEWALTFTPQQIGERQAPTVTAPSSPVSDLSGALASLEDILAAIPPIILPNVTGPVIFAEQALRGNVLSMTASIGGISGIPTVTQSDAANVSSFASEALTYTQILAAIMDLSSEDVIATDLVTNLLSMETWRRDFAAAVRILAAIIIRARNDTESRVVDDYIAVITIRAGQTLRRVALEYYGDADDWPTIADANNLTSSVVAPGTRIYVPRRSQPATGAST